MVATDGNPPSAESGDGLSRFCDRTRGGGAALLCGAARDVDGGTRFPKPERGPFAHPAAAARDNSNPSAQRL